MKNSFKDIQVTKLHKEFDKLQEIYGSKNLDSIYGAGCIHNPKICFVFMNPTGKNVASDKSWKGLKAQWLGTKNIWKLLNSLNLIDQDIYKKTQELKPLEWDYDFAYELYQDMKKRGVYITNLGKCTQDDARPLSNKVFYEYLDLLEKEIDIIKPEKIIAFGNQVSSILLNQNISVSKCRKQCFIKTINNHEYKVYPVYYPVGQGMRNIPIAIEDINFIVGDNNVQ